MTRNEYLRILHTEGLTPHRGIKNFLKSLLYILYDPPINAKYLLRKMQYYASCSTPYKKIRVLQLRAKLMRRYGIHISPYAEIGVGLHMPHPTSIVIGAKTTIGENCTIYQNVTIGGARTGDVKLGNQPVIGNNVTVFSGAMILGRVNVGNNVIIAANSVLLSNAEENGVYTGTPAKRVK